MARMTSLTIGGYYPFPDKHLPAVARLFKPAQHGGFLLDPCAGVGTVVAHLADALHLTPYANELDLERAAQCRERFGLTQAMQGDLFTLRTPHNAYVMQWVNPPYTHNSGAEESRREFEMLQHAWQWTQFGGFTLWIVYAHHMTQRAAKFLLENSDLVDVYRIPGLHLGEYPQIIVVARKTDKHEVSGEAILALVDSCRNPDTLTLLEQLTEPRYQLPAPAPVKRFYFHPDKITPDVMLPALQEYGVHLTGGFQALVEPPLEPAELAPIVPPRGGQVGLILAAGLFDGLLLDLPEGQAAVRGVVRMVEVDTTPPGMHEVKETYEIRPQVTITLLHRNGQVKSIAGENEGALIAFLKENRSAFLKYLDEHSKPLYDFEYRHLEEVFSQVFQNRKIPGRPVTGLFETQRHVVAAAYAALMQRKGVIIVGEMGTGKSAMGAALAAALHNKGHLQPGEIAVIMCPPHLTKKWVREAKDAIPSSVVEIVESVDDVVRFMAKAQSNPATLHVMILSRERGKLGEGWEPATLTRKRYFAQWPFGTEVPPRLTGKPRIAAFDVPSCPGCGEPIAKNKDGTGVPVSESWLKQQPRTCHKCRSPLWQLKRTFSAPRDGEKFPSRNPRYPLARFLRDRYRNRVGVALIDELHEAKSGASDQGRAMQDLVGIARKAIGLTGTLFGGMASSVFWLEWAFNDRMYHQYPLAAGRAKALRQWVRSMGVLERVVEYKEDEARSGSYTTVRRIEHAPQESPGISPHLIAELIDHCLWVGLEDLNFSLPEYVETPVELDLPYQIQAEYNRAKQHMITYLMQLREERDNSFLSTYLQSVLRYPSSCFRPKPITHRLKQVDENGDRIERLVTVMQGYGEEDIYPKEEWLIDQLKEELAEGRRCAVFVSQTGTLDIQPRLVELIQKHVPDANPAVLRQDTVATDNRDSYLERKVKAGHNILIANPRLVQTGLDLLAFPTLIFFECDYSLYVMSQAARRAWRIGQTNECRVFYPYYADTMEAQAIALISRKQAAAALLGGDADGGGLAQLAGGSASLMAELSKTIAKDEGVIDATQLFRKKASESADFTSGWATNMTAEKPDPELAPASKLVLPMQSTETAGEPAQQPEVVVTKPGATEPHKLPADIESVYTIYREAKAGHPEAVVFAETSDSFVTFYPDTVLAARELDLPVTRRVISADWVAYASLDKEGIQVRLRTLMGANQIVALANGEVKVLNPPPLAPPTKQIPQPKQVHRESQQLALFS